MQSEWSSNQFNQNAPPDNVPSSSSLLVKQNIYHGGEIMEHLMRGKSCLLLILAIQFHLAYAFALLPLSVHRRTPAKLHNSSPLSCNDARSRCTSSLNVQKQRCLSLSSTTVEEECDNITVDTYAAAAKTTKRHDLHNSNSRHLMSYALHWDNLLQREYQESVLESQRRRKSFWCK